MVDELNDETEARMDALESRTRALAARVETLTAERDTARASADRWHGVAHRMEEERDAAAKAREAAEAARQRALDKYDAVVEHNVTLMRDNASLRAQVEQLTVERGDYAVKADGLYREIQRLVAQVEQMRGALEAAEQELRPSTGHDVWSMREMEAGKGFGHKCPDCDRCRVLAKVRAALSPSPASGVAALEDDGHIRECGNGGEDPEDCSPACLAARVAAENGTCATCTTGYHDGCDSECSCRQCAPGKDEAIR